MKDRLKDFFIKCSFIAVISLIIFSLLIMSLKVGHNRCERYDPSLGNEYWNCMGF